MHEYVVEYLNENEFKKIERSLKKYNMLAYKKLIFDCVPSLRDGSFQGEVVSKNSKEGIIKYDYKLPTDHMFSKVHGDIILHYTVYENQKIIMLDTISPEEILSEGHQKELSTYKGVMLSKTHAERDCRMFRPFAGAGQEAPGVDGVRKVLDAFSVTWDAWPCRRAIRRL